MIGIEFLRVKITLSTPHKAVQPDFADIVQVFQLEQKAQAHSMRLDDRKIVPGANIPTGYGVVASLPELTQV
jgi:hypothetical protein